MNKERNISEKVVDLFFSGQYSSEIKQGVQGWLIDGVKPHAKERAMRNLWNMLKIDPDKSVYAALARVNRRLGFRRRVPLRSSDRLHTGLRVAAVVLPLLVMAAALLVNRTDGGATLIARYMQQREVVVPNGQHQQVTLSDGSTVLLNAGTRFSWPRWFVGPHREVTLSGEGYFTVAKKPAKPFTVHMTNLTVNVLGTQFDAICYPGGDQEMVKVQRGKVGVVYHDCSYAIGAGRQLDLDVASGELKLKHVAAEDVCPWSRGDLIFDGSSAGDIFSAIERREDVRFDVDGDLKLPEGRYTLKFVDNENLQQMLEVLSPLMGGFAYQIRGDVVKLSKE